MKIKIILILFLFAFSSIHSFSQEGTIIGLIQDLEFQDPVPFANVQVKGTTKGVISDFDGNYTIDLPEGKHTLIFSFMGYKTIEITDINVISNKVTTVNVILESQTESMDEVIVSVSAKKNTEASVLNIQRKAVSLLDGISAESFKKIGAGNIATAVKNVPGVSVQGGKYVYVRGLGDRYTKSILNGVDIPGLDPDRNTVQMDIFPTNILDNVLVIKSSSADLPADFTGGIVNIVTKEFPNQKETKISLSAGVNPSMHFNPDYISYEGGNTDFLGFDDGTRKVPIDVNTQIPFPSSDNASELTNITKAFNPILGVSKQNSGMNFSLGFSFGYRKELKRDGKLGYYGAISYKNTTKYYENAEDNTYRKDPESDIYELLVKRTQKGDIGQNNVILSGLGGISMRTNQSKYKLNLLHIQNGESEAGYFMQQLNQSDFITFQKDNLEYTERAITNILLSGQHDTKKGDWKIEWKLSPTFSSIHDKDVRTTSFQVEDDVYSIPLNNEPKRIWRNLKEFNGISKVDFTRKFELFSNESKLKFGIFGSYKNREFSIYNYQISNRGNIGVDGNANNLLLDENIWTVATQTGSFINPSITTIENANVFDATQRNLAAYVSEEFKIGEKIRTILGVRAEKFDTFYDGQNNQGTVVYDNENILNEFDIFPSANIICALNEKANLRTSYSRTTARPSFKEASIAEIYDPLSNQTFLGNINILPTYINNFDLRYEYFGELGQMIAFSGFYKKFKDPIELTYDRNGTDNFQPNNLGDANVIGVELEVRKNLGFITEDFKNLVININASYIDSKLEMGEDEIQSRTNYLRDGETLKDTRELQGQSPYLINAGINYDNQELGLQSGLFYNVQGKTLQVVGTGEIPDVYTLPLNSLNYTFSKTLGKQGNSSINFKIDNILGDKKESVYESFNATNKHFILRELGTTFTLGYSVKF